MKPFIIGALVVGLLCVLTMPAVHIGAVGEDAGSGLSGISLFDILKLLNR